MGDSSSVEKVLPKFDTKKGGTNRYSRLIIDQKGPSNTVPVIRKVFDRCQNSIAKAAVLVVIQNLRLLSFTEEKLGTVALLESVFLADETVPAGLRVSSKSYIPSRTVIGN